MPSRFYLRLATDLPDRKSSYPDGAFRAFVEILCYADGQPERGTFRNERILRGYLGRRSRWIRYLLDEGDLIARPSGALYVQGWHEWQEGDLTVAERARRYRARRNGVTPGVTDRVTPTVTPGVTEPVTVNRLGIGIGTSRGINRGSRNVTSPVTGRPVKPGEHAGQHGPDCLVCHPPDTERPPGAEPMDKSRRPGGQDGE